MKELNLLFLGNGYTYSHNMPSIVQSLAEANGYECHTKMISYRGWSLAQHASEPNVRFNILFGGYDYIILQEHAQTFDPEEAFISAVVELSHLIHQAGAIPVMLETWTKKTEYSLQDNMNTVCRRIAADVGALLAPAGESWWSHQTSWSNIKAFDADGQNITKAGSEFAAIVTWKTICIDLKNKYYPPYSLV